VSELGNDFPKTVINDMAHFGFEGIITFKNCVEEIGGEKYLKGTHALGAPVPVLGPSE
jgi:hypothetical protein